MRVHPFFPALAATAVMALAAWGANVPAAVDTNDGPAIKALVNNLGSPEFATREKAQRALEAVPFARIDLLRDAARATADPETKARLRAVIKIVEEAKILTAPPVSLEVRDATILELARALGVATTSQVALNPALKDRESERFTLKADSQPYWEVIGQLHEQHPLWIQGRGKSWENEWPDQILINRGLAFFGSAYFASDAMYLDIAVASDPRIKLFDFHGIGLVDIRDEHGQIFDGAVRPFPEYMMQPKLAAGETYSQRYRLGSLRADVRGVVASSISVKGTINFLAGLSETTVELADAGRHFHEAITVGDSKVTLCGVEPIGEGAFPKAAIRVEVVPVDSKTAAPAPPDVAVTSMGFSLAEKVKIGPDVRVSFDSEGQSGGLMIGPPPNAGMTQVIVSDANGKTIAKYAIPHGLPVTSVHYLWNACAGPLKFTFIVPETREVTIPFEFKNLPIK